MKISPIRITTAPRAWVTQPPSTRSQVVAYVKTAPMSTKTMLNPRTKRADPATMRGRGRSVSAVPESPVT